MQCSCLPFFAWQVGTSVNCLRPSSQLVTNYIGFLIYECMYACIDRLHFIKFILSARTVAGIYQLLVVMKSGFALQFNYHNLTRSIRLKKEIISSIDAMRKTCLMAKETRQLERYNKKLKIGKFIDKPPQYPSHYI